MAYKVVLTKLAEEQLTSCFYHIFYEYINESAAKSFLDDAESTLNRLSNIADGLPICEDDYLKKFEYRIIHFKKYRYKMIHQLLGHDILY